MLPEDVVLHIAGHLAKTHLFRDTHSVVSDIVSLIHTSKTAWTVRLYTILQELVDPGCTETAFALRNCAEFLLRKNLKKTALIQEYRKLIDPILPKGCSTKQNIIDHLVYIVHKSRHQWMPTKGFRERCAKYRRSRISRHDAEGIFLLLPTDIPEYMTGDKLLIWEVTAVAAKKLADGHYSRHIQVEGQSWTHPPNFLLNPLYQKYRLETINHKINHNSALYFR
jgi:hypothetical protein